MTAEAAESIEREMSHDDVAAIAAEISTTAISTLREQLAGANQQQLEQLAGWHQQQVEQHSVGLQQLQHQQQLHKQLVGRNLLFPTDELEEQQT